ncbi:unnamed protein product, partial [Didymodactylos carnosus]
QYPNKSSPLPLENCFIHHNCSVTVTPQQLPTTVRFHFIRNLSSQLKFYSDLLVLFDFIPNIEILNIKCKWFELNEFICNYDYECLAVNIKRLKNFQLCINQISFQNGYDMVELLIINLFKNRPLDECQIGIFVLEEF